jgi:hypothetical protein
MRRLLLVLALVLPAFVHARELAPGTLEIAGGSSLSFSNLEIEVEGDDQDTDTFQFDLNGYYYVVPNLGLGLGLLYQDISNDPGSDVTSVAILPQLTYQVPVADKLGLFVGAGLGYASVEMDDDDASGLAWMVEGGLKIFPVRWLSLNGGVRYTGYNLETDGDLEVDVSDFTVGAGLSFYFGGR